MFICTLLVNRGTLNPTLPPAKSALYTFINNFSLSDLAPDTPESSLNGTFQEPRNHSFLKRQVLVCFVNFCKFYK